MSLHARRCDFFLNFDGPAFLSKAQVNGQICEHCIVLGEGSLTPYADVECSSFSQFLGT